MVVSTESKITTLYLIALEDSAGLSSQPGLVNSAPPCSGPGTDLSDYRDLAQRSLCLAPRRSQGGT